MSRHGIELPVTAEANGYLPADIVTWMPPGNRPHIGVVTDRISKATGNPLIVHNIGSGPKLDDILFSYKVTGHYRYSPQEYKNLSNQRYVLRP